MYGAEHAWSMSLKDLQDSLREKEHCAEGRVPSLLTVAIQRIIKTSDTIGDLKYACSDLQERVVKVWYKKNIQRIEAFAFKHAEVLNLIGHTDYVTAVAVLRNDDVVTASADETTRIWDHKTGQVKHILHSSGRIVALAVLSNDDVVTEAYSTITIWDSSTGQEKRQFTIVGRTIAVLNNDDIVTDSYPHVIIWDSLTGKRKQTKIWSHRPDLRSLPILSNGDLVAYRGKIAMIHKSADMVKQLLADDNNNVTIDSIHSLDQKMKGFKRKRCMCFS